MAKKTKMLTKQVRISLQGYELIRREAFKQHKTMLEVADDIIRYFRKGV